MAARSLASRSASSNLEKCRALMNGESNASSSETLITACLQNVRKHNTRTNAFASVFENEALHAAQTADKRIVQGERRSVLDGVPIAVKDNFVTTTGHTTAASRALSSYRSPFTATVVERLEKAGAVVIGKTNMDEFGMGSFSTNSMFGPVENPLCHGHVAGGSSGGSASAVAADSCFAALGSDTGGSVRLPASYCGLVGVKPTYGRASRMGLIAYASSLDCPGVLAHTIPDAAHILDAICGYDPKDSTSVRTKAPLVHTEHSLDGDLSGMRVGVPAEFNVDELDDEVRNAWQDGVLRLQAAGATIVDVSIPSVTLALPAYYIIAPAEASSNLACYDSLRYGACKYAASGNMSVADWFTANRSALIGIEVQKRIAVGAFVLSNTACDAFFKQAQRVRRMLCDEFASVFETSADVLLTPTATSTAPLISEVDAYSNSVSAYLNDVMTVPPSLAGLPAASVPCSTLQNGLPLGLQLIGAPFDEYSVLRAGVALQRSTKTTEQLPISS